MRNPDDVRERCVVCDGVCEFIRNTIVSSYTFMHVKEALARESIYVLWDQQGSHKPRRNEMSSIGNILVLRVNVSLL